MKTIILSTLIAATALAQSPAERAISTMHGTETRNKAATLLKTKMAAQIAPELFSGEMDDVGPQFLLVPRADESTGKASMETEKHRWIEAFADAQVLYTSNALLTEKGNSDTALVVLTLQAAAVLPRFELLGGQVESKAGYRHQWWMYSLTDSASQLNNFDFAVSTFFVQSRASFGAQWSAGVGLDYNRLLSHDDDWAEFYTEFVPSWYVERNFSFGEKAQLTAGFYGAYHWTHTDDLNSAINDRLDSAFGIIYSHEIAPQIVVQPFYRLQWSHYTENTDRNDIFNTVGLSINYNLNEWSSLRVFSTYENRNSTDDAVADYQKWDSGFGVAFSTRF